MCRPHRGSPDIRHPIRFTQSSAPSRVTAMRPVLALFLLTAALACTIAHAGSITDLSQWRLVEDPPNANFTATDDITSATLNATGGPISPGTDIGYQSVSGGTVAGSGSGFYFSPDASFSLAIDYAFAFGPSASGTLGIGFGIGEDIDGADSAGVAMLVDSFFRTPVFGAAGRVNDSNVTPIALGSGSLAGSMFLEYVAGTGSIVVGYSSTPGGGSPTSSGTFASLQDLWDDDDLLVSFFLRSETGLISGWQGGTAEAVFSNLRVLSGTPREIGTPAGAPLPPSLALLAPGLLLLRRHRRAQSSPEPAER